MAHIEDEAKDETPATEAENEAEAAEKIEETAPDFEARIAELNDKLMRTLAELENTRRRAERERSEASKFGIAQFARDIIGVADNLHRALDALPQAARATLDENATALLDGVAATERELAAVLARHKITAIDAVGVKFDPNLHEALFEVPDAKAEAGTVLQVAERGYMIDDRLLRPARVGVASTPEKGEKAKKPDDA